MQVLLQVQLSQQLLQNYRHKALLLASQDQQLSLSLANLPHLLIHPSLLPHPLQYPPRFQEDLQVLRHIAHYAAAVQVVVLPNHLHLQSVCLRLEAQLPLQSLHIRIQHPQHGVLLLLLLLQFLLLSSVLVSEAAPRCSCASSSAVVGASDAVFCGLGVANVVSSVM